MSLAARAPQQRASTLVCIGCGYVASPEEINRFRCPRAASGDDVDHVLHRVLEPTAFSLRKLRRIFGSTEKHPLIKYRQLLHSYIAVTSLGMSDRRYRKLVLDLDARVREIDGRGLHETPYRRQRALGRELGLENLWVKDETRGVAGSHKARHLMGVMVWLQAMQRLFPESEVLSSAPLAIASCGNAALGAAVVARAAERELKVFIPDMAHPVVVRALVEHGADLTICERTGRGTGDPSYRRFLEAVDAGAIPFSVQGPQNGLTIDSGKTLAWEMVATELARGRSSDRLFLQVGGGALATAVIEGLREVRDLGLIRSLPRIHAVQTRGVSPLARCYERVVARIIDRYRAETDADAKVPERPVERADWIRSEVAPAILGSELNYATHHRSSFMWPWEEPKRSFADGILDDETYDWTVVVLGMLETGGFPVVISEDRVRKVYRMARRLTDIRVGPTGAAGLAGCHALARARRIGADEHVSVLFTGVKRWERTVLGRPLVPGRAAS